MFNEQQEAERREKILRVVKCFIETNGSMEKISEITKIPSSTVQRYLKNEIVIELCGLDVYNYIQNKIKENKQEAVVKGGKTYAENNQFTKDELGKFTGSRKK